MIQVVADVGMVDDRNKVRHADAAVKRAHAHSQLVAKIAHGGEAHARNAQMFAQRGGGFHVVFIERDDTIEFVIAREMSDCAHDVGQGNLRRKIEGVVEALTRPVGVAQFFRGQQNHAAILPLALAHELLALLVGRDAQESQRARVRHGISSGTSVLNQG